jgi:hypothetical protein
MLQKIKISAGLLIVSILLFSFAEVAQKKSSVNMVVKGKPRMCTETDFQVKKDSGQLLFSSRRTEDYDTLGRISGGERYDGKGKLSGSYVNNYDHNGNISAAGNYDAKGKLTRHMVSKYDLYNRVKETDGYNYNPKGDKTQHDVKKYDAAHRPLHEYTIDYMSGTRTNKRYHYRLAASRVKHRSNKMYNQVEKLNDRGQVVEGDVLNADSTIRRKNITLYNADGVKTGEQFFDSDSAGLYMASENNFDSDGHLTKNVQYNRDGHVAHLTLNKFTFDTAGNWVTDSVFTNDTLTFLKRRDIRYY